MRYLPGYFSNVSSQVDGIVALDDGSTDGSGPFVASQLKVLELVRKPARTPLLDPDCRFQALGYAYLTDESGLRLERLPAGRGYTPLGIGG